MKESKLISSADNPVIKRLKSMQDVGARSAKVRSETSLALIEGVHLAQSWLGSEDLHELFTTHEGLNQAEVAAVIETQLALVPTTNLYIIEESLWNKVTDLGHAPPILGCIKIPQVDFPSNFFDDIVILDAIQDAGNVGSILRTAAGAGVKYVACMKGTAQVWSPKVLRAAMGAHRHLKIFEFWSLNTLREKIKQPLLATSSYAQESLYDMPHELQKACAWVFGNEGKGVSSEIMGIARGLNIPQESCIESLNVAASAAICLFEMVRARRC
jgi:TrmH family RNA methyltransferase